MSRKYISLVFTALFFVALTVVLAALFSMDSRKPQLVIAGEKYSVELAVSQAERAVGLSNREFMPLRDVMLFVFPEDERHSIWMKDMQFSLDVVWLDSNFKVVDIREWLRPESYPESFVPSVPARYVVEANTGFVKGTGIKIGDSLEFKNVPSLSL